MKLPKRKPSFNPKIYATHKYIGKLLFGRKNIVNVSFNIKHLKNPQTTCTLVFKYYLL